MSILTNKTAIILLLIIKLLLIQKSNGSCFFPSEFTGSYAVQASISNIGAVLYNDVKILDDSISLWGSCIEKIENTNNFILQIDSNGEPCYRCLSIKLVSRNIIRIYVEKDSLTICTSNETEAREKCPNYSYYKSKTRLVYTEIILYKKLTYDGLFIKFDYCPINGRYNFKYKKIINNVIIENCVSAASILDNCPSGSAMNLRYEKCTFPNYEKSYECLGNWEDYNNKKFMAFIDYRAESEHYGPKYRCANYDVDANGLVNIIFSQDSTCSAMNFGVDENNKNISYSETMLLYPTKKEIVYPNLSFCIFPSWMEGDWQYISVYNDTITYRDQDSYKVYTMKCIELSQNFNQTGKLILYSRSQCSEESYICLKIKSRAINIIELKLSQQFSKNLTSNICDDYHFHNVTWLTQGREQVQYQYSVCPISGEFVGHLPDSPSLCTKLSTDCESKNIMYYKVAACVYEQVYEERKYRCLGQWKEGNMVYAYVHRLDIDAYECFIGSSTDEKLIYLREGGASCQRYLYPVEYGMQMNKIGYCEDSTKKIKYYSKFKYPDLLQHPYNTQQEDGKPVDVSLSHAGKSDNIDGHYNEQELGDTISIPSDVVISKLSENNKHLLEEHLLLGPPAINTEDNYVASTKNSTISINIPVTTQTTPEREADNEVDKPNNSNNNRKNKKKLAHNKDKNSGSCRIVLNLMLLLSLSILFFG